MIACGKFLKDAATLRWGCPRLCFPKQIALTVKIQSFELVGKICIPFPLLKISAFVVAASDIL